VSGSNIKIGFLLLCHEHPDIIIRLISMKFFNNKNCRVYIHYDKGKPKSWFKQLADYAKRRNNIFILTDRIVCKWGEFSLVEATTNMMEACLSDTSFRADYLYLISGSCTPIKSFATLQKVLFENKETEFIECNSVDQKKWIIGGLDEDRYKYYFPFNFIEQRKKFERFVNWQKNIGLERKKPANFDPHFGSQWFCITSKAARYVVDQMRVRETYNFFKYCWIPDEFAIQSLVYKVSDSHKIANKSLTYFYFNSFGKPLVFYNDHFDFLANSPHVFARKVSKEANNLYNKLDEYTGSNSIQECNVNARKPTLEHKLYEDKHLNELKGGKIGRVRDQWKDGIDKNEKKYYILTGPCKYLIEKMVNKAAEYEDTTVFNYIFNKYSSTPHAQKQNYRGFTNSDIIIRNYDPIAFLYQVVHSVDGEVCFAFDQDEDLEQIKNIIRWDYNANVMIVEPHWRNESEKLVSYLNETEAEEILGLNVAPNELTNIIHNVLREKDKNLWTTLLHSKEHNANIKWLEESDNYFAKTFKKLKSEYYQHTYLPEPNKILLNTLYKNNIHI